MDIVLKSFSILVDILFLFLLLLPSNFLNQPLQINNDNKDS
jgi:hypothetical protein